jgi:HEAT repeat protein
MRIYREHTFPVLRRARGLPALVVLLLAGLAAQDPGFAAAQSPSAQGGAAAAVDDSADLQTKLAAIETAAESRDRQTLRSHLRDLDGAVQQAAFDALAGLDATAAIKELLLLIRDTSNLTRAQALCIFDQSALVDGDTATGVLRSLLADPDAPVSDYAREALAQRAPADSGGIESEDSQLRLAAATAAASRGGQKALGNYLDDTDAAVQVAAFDALAGLDPHAAISQLLAIFRDANNPARWQTLWLLDQSPLVDEKTALAVLHRAASDADPLVAEYATQALARRQQDAAGSD